MKKLYFIQYFKEDLIIENKIKSLGRTFKVFGGWVVESTVDAKQIHTFITEHNDSMSIVVFGLDKSNYYGRFDKDLWNFFK